MSDLQCAATAVVLPAGGAVDHTRLRAERPVRVLTAAPETAAELAGALDLPVGSLADDAVAGGVEQLTSAMTQLAGEYRGECVAIVVPAAVLTQVAGQVLPTGTQAAGLRVEIDADGQRWSAWPAVSAATAR